MRQCDLKSLLNRTRVSNEFTIILCLGKSEYIIYIETTINEGAAKAKKHAQEEAVSRNHEVRDIMRSRRHEKVDAITKQKQIRSEEKSSRNIRRKDRR